MAADKIPRVHSNAILKCVVDFACIWPLHVSPGSAAIEFNASGTKGMVAVDVGI